MHPAYSVIIFTTLSGAGYGLLSMLALFALAHGIPPDRWFGLTTFLTAFAMITAGLLSSSFHLGHPERAWRAFSQWKSSWLSREGVLAVATYGPALVFAFGWIVLGTYDGTWRLFAGITILLSLLTVFCTAMIYASLRPIRAWFNPNTVRVYLAFSLWTGCAWFNLMAHLFGVHTPWVGVAFVITGIAALFFQRKYWMFMDSHPSWVSPENATGLGDIGKVRLLDAPATQENYVQQEMGYRIARKHAVELRRYAFFGYFLIPWLLGVLTIELDPWIRILAAAVAAVVVMAGTLVQRWLFFAEAKHTVMLYYGAEDS